MSQVTLWSRSSIAKQHPPASPPAASSLRKAAVTFDQALQTAQIGEVWAQLDQLVDVVKTVWYQILLDPEIEDKRAACDAAVADFESALDGVLTDWLGGQVVGKRAVGARLWRAAAGLLRQRARLAVEAAAAALQQRGVPAETAWSRARRTTAGDVYARLTGIPEPPGPRG